MKPVVDAPANASGDPDDIVQVALAQRARQMRAGLDAIIRTVRLGPWIVGAAAILPCIALAAGDGNGDLPMMAAITLSAFLSSIAGFGFSAICGAFLFHLSHDPLRVVEIMITCSVANQASMTWSLRHNINWRELGHYLAGGGVGVAIGVRVLLHTDRFIYTHVLGAFLLAYGVYMLVHRPMVLRRRYPGFDFIVGLLGGITGGAVGFPSAPVSIWCGMQGWDRVRQRAILQPFILITQVASLLAITLARHHTAGHEGFGMDTLLFIPASMLASSLGLALYHRMSDTQFTRAVNVLLIVSGLSLVD